MKRIDGVRRLVLGVIGVGALILAAPASHGAGEDYGPKLYGSHGLSGIQQK